MNIDRELDVRGLNCPLPVLRTKNALLGLAAGKILRVIATDPAAPKDLLALANHTGNELLEASEANGEYVLLLRKQ